MKKNSLNAPNFVMELSRNKLNAALKEQQLKYEPAVLLDVPTQLSLLLDKDPCNEIVYSVLAYLFDMIPKGIAYGRKSSEHSLLERSIEIETTKIHIEQTPALIKTKKKGIEEVWYIFPGKQEEKVLQAIQFICLSNGNIEYDEARSTFLYKITLHDIYKHLQKTGDMLNHRQIRESLLILHYSNLTIFSEDKRNRFGSSLLPDLVMNDSSKPGRKSIEEATILLSFHVLYKLGIQTGNVVPFPDFVATEVHRSLPMKILKILCFHFITAGKKQDKITDNLFRLDCDFVRDISLEQLKANLSEMKKEVGKNLLFLKDMGYIKSYEADDVKQNGRLTKSYFKIVAAEKLIQIVKGSHMWYIKTNGKRAKRSLSIGQGLQIPLLQNQ